MLHSNPNNAINSIAQNAEKRKSFDDVKRIFEQAHASGKDYAPELMDLSTAIAYSVVGKCIDPQRKTAQAADKVSNSGHNPALIDLKRGIAHDLAILENTRYCAERATRTTYNADGDTVTEIADKDAHNALTGLAADTLTDGIDLVQTAALAILEQAAEHANGEKWLDTPYTVRRLSKRVYIKASDSPEYRNEQTTPIQEAYRAVRRAIQNSRAVQTDPRNGYTYVEDYTADGLDTIYLRLGKYADLGGEDCNGNYTAGIHDAQTYESIMERLNLTDRQATIIHLRMQGYGYKAIATYLGVTHAAIAKQCVRLRDKCAAIGFMPNGYEYEPKPETEPTNTGKPVVMMDESGKVVAEYPSVAEASRQTGIERRGISKAIYGKEQKTAGGYYWKFAE